MVPDFITTEGLLDYRRWRPEQVDALLGQPDAIFAVWRRKRKRAFFRYRVEAAEQTIGFRAHEDRPDQPGHNWMAFQFVCHDAFFMWGSWAFGVPRPEDRERLATPIFRMDDLGFFRCKACGAVHNSYDDVYFDRCSHKPKPLWIEQTRSGYKILEGRGALFAHFPYAVWALPLAMAITGQKFWPLEVIPEQLDMFHFAGRPR
jgi:hypothetical protein